MTSPRSTLECLLHTLDGEMCPRPQPYFKSSLTALSHAMEDQILALPQQGALVIASFQEERFYQYEADRYHHLANWLGEKGHVYVLAAPDTDFYNASGPYECIAFAPEDALHWEWNLVILSPAYSACLICRDLGHRSLPHSDLEEMLSTTTDWLDHLDQSRQFEGIWTFDRAVVEQAAKLLLAQIVTYRPNLQAKVAETQQRWFGLTGRGENSGNHSTPFADRLVTYLQTGQQQLMQTYRSLAAKERQERLINVITTAIRQSLDPQEVLKVAVQELGKALQSCRTLVYACEARSDQVMIQHEFLGRSVLSLLNQPWPLAQNPLFQQVAAQQAPVYLPCTQNRSPVKDSPLLQQLVREWQIGAWLLLPVIHQGQLLGILELHHCGDCNQPWYQEDLELAEAVATQIGVALIQARSFAHLEQLNQQLAALEQTRDNLTAIVGHELRTPLSTVQVCLESLASEPDMPLELQQVMIETALTDAERLRRLVQDFLTLSRLETGRMDWHLEPLSIEECIHMALGGIKARQDQGCLPTIVVTCPPALPLIQADGEWVVEVLGKLLDNACKFTPSQGTISIHAQDLPESLLQVTVEDTGRGIDPDRLETVFDRFYQEEGALRRTVGGTGLGLAISRQIIQSMGGSIWAESPGRDRGSRFHFTLPTAVDVAPAIPKTKAKAKAKPEGRKRRSPKA